MLTILNVLSKDANLCAIRLSQNKNKNIFPQCLILTNKIFKNKISIKIINFFIILLSKKML